MKHIPSKVLSLLLSLTLLTGLCTLPTHVAESGYTDTQGQWAETAIQRWSDCGGNGTS